MVSGTRNNGRATRSVSARSLWPLHVGSTTSPAGRRPSQIANFRLAPAAEVKLGAKAESVSRRRDVVGDYDGPSGR